MSDKPLIALTMANAELLSTVKNALNSGEWSVANVEARHPYLSWVADQGLLLICCDLNGLTVALEYDEHSAPGYQWSTVAY